MGTMVQKSKPHKSGNDSDKGAPRRSSARQSRRSARNLSGIITKNLKEIISLDPKHTVRESEESVDNFCTPEWCILVTQETERSIRLSSDEKSTSHSGPKPSCPSPKKTER